MSHLFCAGSQIGGPESFTPPAREEIIRQIRSPANTDGKNKNKNARNKNMKKVMKKKRNSADKMRNKNIWDMLKQFVGKKEKEENNLRRKGTLDNKRGVGTCGRQSGPDDGTCMANIGTTMLYVGNQVTNFMKQKKRTESFVKLIERKGRKNFSFVNTTGYLQSACSKSPRYGANNVDPFLLITLVC